MADLLQKDPHALPFQPLGRARMREWVQINLEHSQDYRQYRSLLEQSVQHVLSLQGRR